MLLRRARRSNVHVLTASEEIAAKTSAFKTSEEILEPEGMAVREVSSFGASIVEHRSEVEVEVTAIGFDVVKVRRGSIEVLEEVVHVKLKTGEAVLIGR